MIDEPSDSDNLKVPRIAYLTNLYPSPSHTFIRREILGLESIGWRVFRFAHRHSTAALVDPADEKELARTEVLLDNSASMLGACVFAWLVKRPVQTLRTAALALVMAWRGDRRFAVHAGYFVLACALSDRLRRSACQHVHVHFGTNPAAVACLAHRLSGLSYSVTFHGPHEFDPEQRLNLRCKVESAMFVSAVSRTGYLKLVEQFPEFAAKFRVMPCGLDEAWFNLPPSSPGLGCKLLCIARLDPQKNPLLLLAAALLLVQRGTVFRLVIAGDGGLREDMAAFIAAENLGSCVELTGWCTQQQVMEHLHDARALVLSSRDEGLPMAIMEAFAAGVPAIAPDVGGVRELVETGLTGWLVEKGNAVALADAMQACLEAPISDLRRMGEVGRVQVQQHAIQVSVGMLDKEFRGGTQLRCQA